ncbi:MULTISPECIES: DUF2804 domain-containing protein [unclassified Streptomyces]|uniref:DUF2804 domain-containing protein n=1 Tax=unclassified Streptomyces TaxID=2593676 RepID=UPI00225145F3|nr:MULTISPECIES: DUF2804 domain-containing protein [unclassified Streptomyces]MCX4796612.1 DUF2804 domain-containing protein [Streptomyces sp. NBC_01242]WSJ37846.1 DUF2804 domain-containing protein [Streptomyces sp. NBC_01321]WSP64248.1 DUF2804 domain-containing protein [Streptomyces sp. NBC_01240]WSU23376.1 DUF2804 domain-containing protein [Streptomyces sp. NBC_01108]
MATHEREINEPVDLCLPDGRLNPAARGWSRQPLHRANLRGWGRTKRWDYWCVTTPTHLVALTVSDLDFLALNTVYVLEYGPDGVADEHTVGTPAGIPAHAGFERTAIIPGGRGVRLPETIAGAAGSPAVVVGPLRPSGGRVRIEIREEDGGTRLRARCLTPSSPKEPVEVDLFAALPAGHETLSVVVPWSERRFQYTSKHTARPATGTVRIGNRVLEFGDDAWAVLDHGRGRWPRSVDWNWGAASGRTDGHTVGLQFGGRWTSGTGATENALCVDGRLTKIGEELEWRWSPTDFMTPWTIASSGERPTVNLTFIPFHNRSTRTDAGLIANRTDQCFGHYSGRVRDDEGREIVVDRLLGWAEDVHMRW